MARPRTTRALIGVTALAALSSVALSACGSADASGNVLTWYINPDGGGSNPTKGGQAQLAAECGKASGGRYSIQIQLLPNSASDQRDQLLRRLAAKDPGVDIMSMDPVFVAEFAEAGFLDEVPQDKQAVLTEDAVKPIIESAQWKGKLVAAPMWANTQLLWYRKSVAEAAGLDMSKPVTWDQIIEAAQSQKKLIGVQSKRYEGYTVWINALLEGAGGAVVKNPGATGDDLQLGLDSPEGRKAAEVIQKVARTGVGGPAMGSLDEPAALDQFVNPSTSGFLINWPYVWAAFAEKKVDFIPDIAWTKYPQTVAGKESKPPLGGIELGVNAASQKKAQAWEAIQCITTKEHQVSYMVATGNPAARRSAYDDPAVKEKFPMAAMIRDSLDAGAPRPLTQYYGDVSTALQKTFSPPDEVNPQSTPAQAADLIQSVLKGEALL